MGRFEAGGRVKARRSAVRADIRQLSALMFPLLLIKWTECVCAAPQRPIKSKCHVNSEETSSGAARQRQHVVTATCCRQRDCWRAALAAPDERQERLKVECEKN